MENESRLTLASIVPFAASSFESAIELRGVVLFPARLDRIDNILIPLDFKSVLLFLSLKWIVDI